ncbi:RING-type domain-containing protein [Mycena venus]|uniref:RING-type domain-containing protein n=1 Tax=Mycena venus TaxID=2733690 RepID=A0A8H6Z3H8_9AGAR|nr:RING-type domain-containing protein [Mycena venus]
MLSLGPGSACDLYQVEDQVERPTCPLCRTSFSGRHIKLHVDLDNIPPSSFDALPVPSNADDGARQLQNRITQVAATGATEAQTTQLTEECKKFLSTMPKEMYSDLRTSYKMLSYMCQVKRNFVDQGRTVNQLQRNISSVSQEMDRVKQEVDRVKAAYEALKLVNRTLEHACQTASTERDEASLECNRLHEQLLLVTEQNETAQNQLVLLNEELQRLRVEGEFSSPEGDSPADIRDFSTQLPPSIAVVESDSEDNNSGAHFLTPWERLEEKGLPDADLPEDPEPSPSPSDRAKPNRGGYCGAAGCPHSCDCMPFLLFSPGSREAAAARSSASEASSMSDVFGPHGAPSGLSLSFNRDRARSRSRSHSRPRSRSLSRAPSPSNPSSGSPLPSMSASMTIPTVHHELRGQLYDILQDPPMSSSLPNMHHSHFPSSLSREIRSEARSTTTHSTPSRDRLMPTAAGQSRDSHLHPFMHNHSGNPSPLHSSIPLSDPQRPPLYRNTSSSSQVVDEMQRSDRERRRADPAAAARPPPVIVSEARPTPMPRPQSHSTSVSPPSSAQASSTVYPPVSRPQLPHTSSSQRVPSSSTAPSGSDAMPRAQAHNAPLPSPTSAVHPPMSRPQLPHTLSSQRLPSSSTLGSDALPRAQAHNGPPPSPSIPNSSVHPMPRPQAHAASASAQVRPPPSPSIPNSSSAHQYSSHPMPRAQAHAGPCLRVKLRLPATHEAAFAFVFAAPRPGSSADHPHHVRSAILEPRA